MLCELYLHELACPLGHHSNPTPFFGDVQLRDFKEGIPYEIATLAKFLETFLESDFEEQNLLCELYLHELACPLGLHSNPVPFSSDVLLRYFSSFVSNHVQWEISFQTFSHNEAHSNLWIRSEPQNPHLLLARHQSVLSCPIQTQCIMELQEKVISTCVNQISKHQQLALEGSHHRW